MPQARPVFVFGIYSSQVVQTALHALRIGPEVVPRGFCLARLVARRKNQNQEKRNVTRCEESHFVVEIAQTFYYCYEI